MSRHVTVSFTATTVSLLLAAGSAARADFNPLALTPDSYGQDGIVELAAPHVSHSATTATMDNGTGNTGYTWYEVGYNAAAPATGVPAAGSTFVSQAQADHSYRMAPNYTNNNAVLISSGVTNATLTPTSPAAFSSLSFLASAGSGDTTVAYIVHHADGGTDTGTFVAPDWFGSGTVAMYPLGRVDAVTRSFQTWDSGIPELFSADVPLTHTGSPVTSIELRYSAGTGNACVLAVSGSTGGAFNPITVTGFNYDMIVEASAESPQNLSGGYTSASMDNGTSNTGFSWYERGFVTSSPNTGVPLAGSTITNQSAADHRYRMAPSYASNDVVYIDSSTSASVTPATPAALSTLSFLGAAGHGPLVIDCVVSHADGTTESGTIKVPDWFGSGTLAYASNGRIDVSTSSVQTWGSGGPALFSMDLALTNTSSAVTNIALSYDFTANTGSPGQVMILAVSGAAGIVPPTISAQPISTNSYAPGSGVQFTVSASSAAPETFRWQKVVGGVASNLSDGGNVSGSTTNTLNISPVSTTDGGSYRVIVSNSGGSVTSSVARLNIVSAMNDVTQSGDVIQVYGGSQGGGAEGVISAIDESSQKYLNVSASSPPFKGPVGLIVTPGVGLTLVKGLRVYTANDAPDRDPTDYLLEGSNDGTTFTLISSGPLTLPDDRNPGGLLVDPIALVNQEVDFPNTRGYATYRLSFNHVKNGTNNNLLQMAEIELLGGPAVQLSMTPLGGGQYQLQWGQGILLESTNILGPWVTNSTATSPFTVKPSSTEPRKFYRVLVQ
jgi:hypothetical protein